MLNNPLFWFCVAFVIFIIIVIFKYSKSIKKTLNDGIHDIEQELIHTKDLLSDAEKLLAEKRTALEDAEQQVIDIQDNMKEEIEIIKESFEQKLSALTTQLEKQAADKIAKAERDAFDLIKNTSVEIAMSSAKKILEQKYKDISKSKQYISSALKDIKLS